MQINISDDYLVGFVEGEGMFYVGIVPSKGTSRTKSGWQVIYFFKVSQNPIGKLVLEHFKRRLGCGYLKANSKSDLTDKSLAYVVRDFVSIRDKVIPFFDNKLVIKREDFEKFKQIINLINGRKHLTKEGIEKIIDLAYSMNSKKRKVSKEDILRAYKN